MDDFVCVPLELSSQWCAWSLADLGISLVSLPRREIPIRAHLGEGELTSRVACRAQEGASCMWCPWRKLQSHRDAKEGPGLA